MIRRWVILLAVFLSGFATMAQAHPGRLDKDGCHTVRKPFTYEDGRVLPKGDRHCHRPLDQGLRLDGKERLDDAPRESKPPAPAKAPTLLQ